MYRWSLYIRITGHEDTAWNTGLISEIQYKIQQISEPSNELESPGCFDSGASVKSINLY